jgi:hypothetical protein
VRKLDPGESATVMDRRRDQFERRKVLVVPDAQLNERGNVRRRVHIFPVLNFLPALLFTQFSTGMNTAYLDISDETTTVLGGVPK